MTYSLGMRILERRVKPLPLATAALASALAIVLGGCGGGGKVADGPLSSGLSIHGAIPRGSVCAPGGRTWAFGLQSFTDYGKTTVALDRVALLHPRNEHLVGSYAVPGGRVLGVVHWPVRNPQTQPGWKDRQAVHGFRLAAGKSFNMVLGVAAIAGGRRATSQGMLVYYHDSSGTYVAKNYWANIIAANTHTCPS
jgi:hypothetical protein